MPRLAGRWAGSRAAPTAASRRGPRRRARPGRDGARLAASGPPTRRSRTSGSVSTLAAARACPRRGTPCRAGPRRAGAPAPRTRVPLEPTSTWSPSPIAEPLGVGGRQLDDLLRAQERAAPARRRPPWSSTASGRCRGAARPWRRAARRAGPSASTGSQAGDLEASRPPRAPASARRGRRSRRASARRRTAPPRTAAARPSGPATTPRSSPARSATSAITCQPARTPPPWVAPLARPIAARRRCTRPSGCVSVPSFSAYASAGKTTSACSRTSPSAPTRARSRSARRRAPASHSARSGCVRSGSACSR